jgi:hypothetical protein
VGLQAVHRDDLLPLAYLDGEGLRPLSHHLVQASIRAANGFCWPPNLTYTCYALAKMQAVWFARSVIHISPH